MRVLIGAAVIEVSQKERRKVGKMENRSALYDVCSKNTILDLPWIGCGKRFSTSLARS